MFSNKKTGCIPPEPTCWVEGECEGLIDHVEEDVASKEDCLHLCQGTLGCKWFTYQSPPSKTTVTPACILYHECKNVDKACTTCVSAEWRCNEKIGISMIIRY